jgi:hypothetical protein
MLPPRYTADYTSNGEQWLFDELRTGAPDDWVVLHSLDIAPGPDARRGGEADFVVIVPGLGAVVLEVKSVARQNAQGQWEYGPAAAPSDRSPFDQAESAMRSIVSFVDGKLGDRRPFFTFGAVTPFGDLMGERNSRGRSSGTSGSRSDAMCCGGWARRGRSSIYSSVSCRPRQSLCAHSTPH